MRNELFSINIPKNILEHHLGNKMMWEQFVFAVALKLHSESSGVNNITPRKIRTLFHCGVEKSNRLFAAIQTNSKLFEFRANSNYVASKSFTKRRLSKSTYQHRGNAKIRYSAYCLKFRWNKKDKLSLKEISRRLRDAIILLPIANKQRQNDFLTLGKTPSSTHFVKRNFGLKYIARKAKVHRSTVKRHLIRYANANQLKIIRHQKIEVRHYALGFWLTDDITLRKRPAYPLRAKNVYVVRDPDEYYLKDSYLCGMWTNVIFNHEKRHQFNVSKSLKSIAQCMH